MIAAIVLRRDGRTFSPYIHNDLFIFFHILVLPEKWGLVESTIPLTSALGCLRVVALGCLRVVALGCLRVVALGCLRVVAMSINFHEQLNGTESAVFKLCRLSLFHRDPFSIFTDPKGGTGGPDPSP